MPRSGGERTRKTILIAAEKLFSNKGYDGTSIQDIATAAKVNKALIYYHFKNKHDIIDSLFEMTLDEMFGMQGSEQEKAEQSLHGADVEEKVGNIIAFLGKKKKILSVMLMEALKNDKTGHVSLFQCADMIISKNVNDMLRAMHGKGKTGLRRDELMMHEFFTGFVPIVFFALFKDKWADYFECDPREMVDMFITIFKRSHIQHE